MIVLDGTEGRMPAGSSGDGPYRIVLRCILRERPGGAGSARIAVRLNRKSDGAVELSVRLIAKRLLGGVFLISLASSILLLSDVGRLSSDSDSERWKIHLLKYAEIEDAEDAEDGVLRALREEGFEVDVDYELTRTTAHGDMATLSGMVDAAVTADADLLITLSTPTLQAALNRSRNLPVVFSLVADPFVAGAGESEQDHLPNVTGVYAHGAYREVVAAVRECLPNARVIGTLFVPSEVNTVFHKDMLEKAAVAAGLELIALPVNSASEIADAAAALCSREIDAVSQVGGNLLSSSFAAISQAARTARLPTFAFLSGQAKQGAVVTVARDYGDGGAQSGRMAARVMRGESPAGIPFEPIRATRTIVNLSEARAVGLEIPSTLLQRADQAAP